MAPLVNDGMSRFKAITNMEKIAMLTWPQFFLFMGLQLYNSHIIHKIMANIRNKFTDIAAVMLDIGLSSKMV